MYLRKIAIVLGLSSVLPLTQWVWAQGRGAQAQTAGAIPEAGRGRGRGGSAQRGPAIRGGARPGERYRLRRHRDPGVRCGAGFPFRQTHSHLGIFRRARARECEAHRGKRAVRNDLRLNSSSARGPGPGSCRGRARERTSVCLRDAFDNGTRGVGQRQCAQIRCDGCRCFPQTSNTGRTSLRRGILTGARFQSGRSLIPPRAPTWT